MIVLNLELDNLFGFEDFKINFSYFKKVENSSIKNKYSFRSNCYWKNFYWNSNDGNF